MVKAFAPANISCMFQIHKGISPETTGSTGLGFTLDKGVTVTVSFSDQTEILFNNKIIDIPTVLSVVKKLIKQTVKIHIQSDFPLGCGFGISGASALASAYALNELFGLEKTQKELALIAHCAEVENGTGLGDVTNQYAGGCLFKTVPSYTFQVQQIELDTTILYGKVFGELSTRSVIENTEVLEKINVIGRECLSLCSQLISSSNIVSLAKLLAISKYFAKESGLLQNPELIATINEIEKNGGVASMIMLGNAVMSTIPFEGSQQYEISSVAAHVEKKN